MFDLPGHAHETDGLYAFAIDVQTCVQDHFASRTFSHALQERMELPVVRWRNSLNSRGAVHVRDCRQAAAMLLADIHGGDHVRKFSARRDVKPFIHFAESDGGREWAESLAHLHHRVDTITHFRMPWIGQDAAMAEGARPELHAAAIPTNHMAICNQAGGLCTGIRKAIKRADFNAAVELLERLFDLGEGVSRPIERHGNAGVADAAILSGPESGGPERGAIIARSRLHKNVVEHAGLQQLSIGGTLQLHTAGKSKAAQTGACSKMLADVQHDTVEALLERCRDIAMHVQYYVIRIARRNEMFREVSARGEVVLTFVARPIQMRSEERRVGKECRSRWAPDQ